jgi:branched-chain amino acid transport system ATP-binding protein
LLNIQNIEAGYGGSTVLHGISLEVKKGELVCIVGPNGAGKTTTLRSITGIITPRKGSIEFEGKNITGINPTKAVEVGIAMVPEGRRVFPTLSVVENLRIGAFTFWNKTTINEKMEEVFQIFPDLLRLKKQLGASLSGGEQQMLAIGRALMGSPRLLLLDEPSMGLSPVLVERIFERLKDFKQKGLTVLMVEQNANMALEVADRGYVLENGSIVIEGLSADLIANEDVKRAYLGI